jgi:hypothetical protein
MDLFDFIFLAIGFALGYGVREAMSRRRREKVRRKRVDKYGS